jgi:hypothetical protein
MRDVTRRLRELERRQPTPPRRVAIIGEHDPEPLGADFVIRLVPAPFPADFDARIATTACVP